MAVASRAPDPGDVGRSVRSFGRASVFHAMICAALLALDPSHVSRGEGKASPLQEEAGWMPLDPANAPPDLSPALGIVEKVQREFWGGRRVEILWDERVSYFDHAWTDALKKQATVPVWPKDEKLWWKDASVYKRNSCEFIRLRLAFDPVRPKEQSRRQGWHVFRRLPQGWRMRGDIEECMMMPGGSWADVLTHEVGFALRRSKSSRREGTPVPDWATDSEIVRCLDASAKTCEEEQKFPLMDALHFLVCDVAPVRKRAHEILVATFGVDFGLPEDMPDQLGGQARYDEVIKWWRRTWLDWAKKNYGEGGDDMAEKAVPQFVPWPKK